MACGAADLVSGIFAVCRGSGGGGEGDLVAEGPQLVKVAAGAASAVGLAEVPVEAEVLVAGGRVGQQVPDDHQDGAGDRYLGPGAADAAGEPAVALAEEGGGAGGAEGGLPAGALEARR